MPKAIDAPEKLAERDFYRINTGEFHFGCDAFDDVDLVVRAETRTDAERKLNEFIAALKS